MPEVRNAAARQEHSERFLLNIHSILERSEANGPGIRSVVWFQGCQIRCPGCWNPDTHSTENSSLVSVDDLLEGLLAIDVDGITITGGEPLDQMDGCIELARRVKSSGRSVVLFTGYHMSEITKRAATSVLQSCFDSILCGPYNRALEKTAELGLLRDKIIWHLSETYSDEDFLSLPEAEIIIAQDYSIVTGLGLPTQKRDRAWFSS